MEKVVGVAAVSLFLLSGCGNNVDSLKNGTLHAYGSTTIGKAFDNYSYAMQTKWRGLETKNGQEVVEANIELRFPPFCGKNKKCNSQQRLEDFLNMGFGAHVYPEWHQKVESEGRSEACTQPEPYSGNINISFLMGKDGGFETSNVEMEYFIRDKNSKGCKYLTSAQLLLDNQGGMKLYTSILDAIYSDNAMY
ncbi:MAG: hypothetical protein ACQEUN_16950 [Pseudomonadota bacterium]